MRLTDHIRHLRLRRSAAAAAVAATGALAVALAGLPSAAAVGYSTGVVATPSIPRCEDNIVILVPGGGNTTSALPEFLPVGAYTSDLGAMVEKPGTSASRTVSYSSLPFVATPYTQVQADGIAQTRSLMARTAAQCPSSTLSLAGYSLGADVASRVAADIGHGRGPVSADRFGSAVLISNPNRSAETVQAGGAAGGQGVFGALPGGYGQVSGRVMDVCNSTDYICNSDERTRNTRSNAHAITQMTAVNEGITGSADMQAGETGKVVAEVPFGLGPGQVAHAASYGGQGGVYPAYGFLTSNF